MTPLNVAMMVSIPLVVAAALAFTLLGSRLSHRSRTRIELAFTVVFYPVLVLLIALNGGRRLSEGDELMALVMAVMAVALSVQGGVFAVRRLRALGSQ